MVDWEQEYQKARSTLHTNAGPSGSCSQPLGLRRGFEDRYHVAHRQLVKQGKQIKLKEKYCR